MHQGIFLRGTRSLENAGISLLPFSGTMSMPWSTDFVVGSATVIGDLETSGLRKCAANELAQHAGTTRNHATRSGGFTLMDLVRAPCSWPG